MNAPLAVKDEDVSASARATPRAHANASRRTAALAIGLLVGAGALLSRLDLDAVGHTNLRLPWWSIAVISVLAELMVFNVEFRKEIYTFTFSEIPLVLGLFFATPLQLLIGRLAGEALFLVVKERQAREKLTLNLASFFAESVVLIGTFQLLGDSLAIDRPLAWAKALVAVGAADLVGFLVVAKAVRWHGGPLQLRSILMIGALTAPVNTSFALSAGILLAREPWAALLLLGLAAFLVVAYRSYSALTQRFESLSLLYDFTRLVSGAQEPDVVLEAILVQAKDLMRAERAEIWLLDGQQSVAFRVDDAGRHPRELPANAGELIESWFSRPGDRTTVWNRDPEDRSRAELAPIAALLESEECIVSPIVEAGAVVGLLAVVNRFGDGGFRQQEATMFATLANHASVALENGRLIHRLNEQAVQLEHDSLHDALTGLPNRVLFAARLDAQVNQLGSAIDSVAVAVMDLDGFKEINDTLGHHAGDRVLVEAGQRIRAIVEREVLVARLGGDEFGLLFPATTTVADVERTGRAIRAGLMLPMHVDGVRINLGISVGIAVGPEHGTESAVLLQRADVAMYDAKAGRGDGVSFYSAESDTNTPRRLTLTNDLHSAIEHGELWLAFQPKVSFDTGRVHGFESLLRWRHRHLGDVGPDEFIPLAERSGTIQQLTEFVLDASLAHVAAWLAEGHTWGVAVNLSMRNLLDRSVVELVGGALARHDVPARLLTLEITESNVMADAGRTIAALQSLADLGVRLSIDDFGTGYSSLSYLQRLPVGELKIDKSFILPLGADESAEPIVRSILDLARNMNLSVVAEGIEEIETWTLLQNLGCHQGQGYFMSRPVAAGDVAAVAEAIERRCLGRALVDARQRSA